MSFGSERSTFLNLDFPLLLSVLTLSVCGVFAIHSALHSQPQALGNVDKQVLGIVIGLGAMVALGRADYTQLLPQYARWLYWINLLLLGFVVIHGHASRGAQRWISLGPVQVQPSEFCKIILIVALALYITRNRDSIQEWRTVFGALGQIALPLALIFKQPDLGTALVILTLWFGMMFIGGARWQHLLLLILAGPSWPPGCGISMS